MICLMPVGDGSYEQETIAWLYKNPGPAGLLPHFWYVCYVNPIKSKFVSCLFFHFCVLYEMNKEFWCYPSIFRVSKCCIGLGSLFKIIHSATLNINICGMSSTSAFITLHMWCKTPFPACSCAPLHNYFRRLVNYGLWSFIHVVNLVSEKPVFI